MQSDNFTPVAFADLTAASDRVVSIKGLVVWVRGRCFVSRPGKRYNTHSYAGLK